MPLALAAGAVDDIEFARRRVAIDAAGRSFSRVMLGRQPDDLLL